MDFDQEYDEDAPGYEQICELKELFIVLDGQWGVRDGRLIILKDANSVIHINKALGLDISLEMNGSIRKETKAELSLILCAPDQPVMKCFDDGYCFQFGSDGMINTKLARNSLDITVLEDVAPQAGVDYTITARVLEGVGTLNVNGSEMLRARDYFALTGSRAGLYGYAAGTQISSLKLFTAGVPRERSCMEIPNTLASRGYYTDAIEEYERIIESRAGEQESDEARFRKGVCLCKLYSTAETEADKVSLADEAEKCFQAVKATPLGALACVGLIEVSVIRVESWVEQVQILLDGYDQVVGPWAEGFDDLLLSMKKLGGQLLGLKHFSLALKIWDKLASSPHTPERDRMLCLKHALNCRSELCVNEQDLEEIKAICADMLEKYSEFTVNF